jgi:hypothetical protein
VRSQIGLGASPCGVSTARYGGRVVSLFPNAPSLNAFENGMRHVRGSIIKMENYISSGVFWDIYRSILFNFSWVELAPLFLLGAR